MENRINHTRVLKPYIYGNTNLKVSHQPSFLDLFYYI